MLKYIRERYFQMETFLILKYMNCQRFYAIISEILFFPTF